MAVGVPLLCIVSMEYNLATCGTGRSGQALGDNLSLLKLKFVEYGVKQFVQLLRLAAHDGCLLVNHTLMQQVDGNLNHCGTGTFAVTGLKEPQLALLNSELHILHIAIVVLKHILEFIQLVVNLRHSLFHRRIFADALLFADTCTLSPALRANLGNLLRSTDSCNNVLALCVYEILTIEEILTVSGIAAEANTSSTGFTHITEYHGHNANSGTPLVWNSFHLAVQDSTLVHPAAEYCADGTPKLLDRIIGEIFASTFLDGGLEQFNQFLQFLYRQVLVELDTTFSLYAFNNFLEWVDVFLVYGLHLENYVTIHLYEATI